MLVRADYRDVLDKGFKTVSPKENLELEIITTNPTIEGQKRTFLKGGKIIAEKLECRLIEVDQLGNPISSLGQGIGYVVRNEDNTGVWILDASKVEEKEAEAPSTPIQEVVKDLGNSNSEPKDELAQMTAQANELLSSKKTYFGFTPKQLLIVGVLLLIVRKL